MNRGIESMGLGNFMNEDEFMKFVADTQSVAEEYPDIIGILAIGSLVQNVETPSDFYSQRRSGPLGKAYESIRNPHRRKPSYCAKSDLDIWVCLKDTPESIKAQNNVDTAGMALIEELSAGTLKRGDIHWRNKKEAVFGDYYKQERLYPEGFINANSQDAPWMASGFKERLEQALMQDMPDFIQRVNAYFNKKIPDSFLEIRAYPQSVFNLRPDDSTIASGVEDRAPFPRIADDQWISPEHTSFILYSADDADIYPFKDGGRVLGVDIEKFISKCDERCPSKSQGGFLIKPDAIQRNEIGRVMEKIESGISRIGGKITVKKEIDRLTRYQVETMYPLLRGTDIKETEEYLTEGGVVTILVESELPQTQLFRQLNAIKGCRVAERSDQRLMEGRITNGAIRDLLPLEGDEDKYRGLIQTVVRKRTDPTVKFTKEQYQYYCHNLVHTPDNNIELAGLFRAVGFSSL